jgi:hypothetical protein
MRLIRMLVGVLYDDLEVGPDHPDPRDILP